jgi:hypothetical protein
VQRSRLVVDVLQDVGDLPAATCFQAFAQVRDHALHVGENDVDHDGIRGLSHARGNVRAGSLDRKTDQLPRRAQPAHRHQQSMEKHIPMPPDG